MTWGWGAEGLVPHPLGQSMCLGGPSPLAMRCTVPRPGWQAVEQRNQQPQTVSEMIRHQRPDWGTNGPRTNGPGLDHATSQEIPSGFGRGLTVELAAFHSPAMALELGVSWAHPTPQGCGGGGERPQMALRRDQAPGDGGLPFWAEEGRSESSAQKGVQRPSSRLTRSHDPKRGPVQDSRRPQAVSC